jgi:hypothetical protein
MGRAGSDRGVYGELLYMDISPGDYALTLSVRVFLEASRWVLGHLQWSDPIQCPKWSKSVRLRQAADTKNVPVRMGGGATQRADA